MDAGSAAAMQMQVRQNAEELQNFMQGLESWEEEIKEKDLNLIGHKPILKEPLPPVRSRHKKRKKKVKVVAADKAAEASRIRSYDYHSWDKFDVDKACEEVDYQVQSSSSSYESGSDSDEEEEDSRRRQRALREKEKGNEFFKKRSYEQAVECYARAMELDPSNAVFPANRAMALLKMERFAAAEVDCTLALELDSVYVKAYLRRGTARCKLKEFVQARQDFEMVLKIEPGNSVAATELEKLDKEIGTSGIRFIRAVKRPDHLRSKTPLKRILIEDVGSLQATPPLPDQETATTTTTTAETATAAAAALPATSATILPGTAPVATITTASATTAAAAITATTTTTTTTKNPSKDSDTTPMLDQPSMTATMLDKPRPKEDYQPNTVLDQPRNKATMLDEPCRSGIEVMPPEPRRDGEVTCDIIQAPPSTSGGDGVERGCPSESRPPLGGIVDTRMNVTKATSGESREQDFRESGSSVSVEGASLPPVPLSSFQFQADWKRLKGNCSLMTQYFKAIPPAKYPVVLQQSLETDVFQDIITILYDDYVRSGEACMAQLSGLTKVKRFSVAIMFLSKPQKEGLCSLFKDLLSLLRVDEDKQRLSVLAKHFSVTIH